MGLKKTIQEFKEFAVGGNVMDMAVAVIIGGAFGKIVTSLVADIITPAISVFLGGKNFADLFYAVDGLKYESIAAAEEAGVGVIKYGQFISNIIDFIIIAIVIFIVLKQFVKIKDKMKKEEEVAEEATTKTCPYCLSEIPLEATRCAHCTSVLEEEAKEA
ncbi:MAG: large conductance mechanosensitive channel protein MscL [Firmicutes bacterium]|nr:large conductance mechanosensitive channel protein MscL [Bacillota bacterium]